MAEQAQKTPSSSVSQATHDQETVISASQPTNTHLPQVEIPQEHDDYQSLITPLLQDHHGSSEDILSDNFAKKRACVWMLLSCAITIGLCAIIVFGMSDVYTPLNLQVGPNSSYLINASPVLVGTIEAEQKGDQTVGPMLYGFHKIPSLDVESTWSESHNASVHAFSCMNWTYYLNVGSQINISYHVISPVSSPLILAIAQGSNSLVQWKNNPAMTNKMLYRKMILGRGNLVHDIASSDFHYVAVGNLHPETARVDLNITMESLLYNTSHANFKCSLIDQVCTFKLLLLRPNAVVLTAPDVKQVKKDDYNWYIAVSFRPQYLSFIIGICLVVASNFLCRIIINFACMAMIDQISAAVFERPQPLLSHGGNNGSGFGLSGSTAVEGGAEVFSFPFQEVEDLGSVFGYSTPSEPYSIGDYLIQVLEVVGMKI